MKKIITILLASVMVLSVATVANASETDSSTNLDEVATNYDIDVNATYVAGDEASTVYSVDIAWGSMVFTYTDSSVGTWDADNHEYENAEDADWGFEENSNKITVTNHSNASVNASLSFEKADDLDITSAFYDANDEEITSLTLDTAVNTSYDEAPSLSAYFKVISGELESDFDDTIGAITVTLSETVVSD